MSFRRRLLGVEKERPSENYVLNEDSPQAQGLVGFWPATKGSGLINPDLTRFGNDGDLVNSPAWEVRSPHGMAIRYTTTSNDQVIVTGTTQAPIAAMSAGAWFYPVTVGNGSSGIIMRGESSGSFRWKMGYFLDEFVPGIGIGCEIMDTGQLVDGSQGDQYIDQLPHLLTCTYDGTLSIYVDGVLKDSDATGTALTSYNNLFFGERSSNAQDFDGWLWHHYLYDRVLSDAEVWAMWHPSTRWDLYHTPRIGVPGFVAAVGGVNPKGPLGMPLHGPFGGPIG